MRISAGIILLASVLAGCGFHLRPPASLPAAMQRTYISDKDNDVQLVRELSRYLTTPNTSVTRDAAKATAIFNIQKSRRYERVLSVSNTGQPLVNQVAYVVDFSLVTRDGGTLIPTQKLILTRQYNYNTANMVGNTEQANILYKAMVQDMVQLILFRLEALTRKPAAQTTSTQ